MTNPLFGSMKSEGLEPSQDRLGGFQVTDSGIYEASIKTMYAGKSSGGATSVSVILELSNGQEYRETVYVSSRKGENFFTKDGKKQPLPGFTVINDICLIATGKELSEQATEEKILKLWNFEEKKEVPTNVPVLTECVGKKVAVAILKQLENKQEKNSAGEYVSTAETKETNLIDKVLHPEFKVTVAEARDLKEGEKPEPKFWPGWEKRNKGQVRDRREIKDGAGAAPGGPPKAGGAPAAAAAPKNSLFGPKK